MNKKVKKSIFFVSALFLGFNLGFGQANPDNIVIPESADALENPYSNDESVVRKGEKVYKKVCWICHGDEGAGDGPSVPTLTVQPADLSKPNIKALSDGALFWWITNGGNGMQPFKDTLSKDQIWMVVNYIRRLQGKM
jgi:mono/diheme cytochrome c family protein